MKNYFEVKKNIVLTGNSRIFNNWAEHSSIKTDDTGKIVDVQIGGENGKLGTIWGGEIFDDGFMRKISLSAKDRV